MRGRGGGVLLIMATNYLTGTFTEQSGYFSYALNLRPAYSTGAFFVSLVNLTGLIPSERISVSGVSGKIFDQDSNYLHTYDAGELFVLSGNVFTGHHNIFIDGVPKNLHCSRDPDLFPQRTGHIGGIKVSGSDAFDYVSLVVRG